MSRVVEIQERLRRAFGDGPECTIFCALMEFLRAQPTASHLTLQLVKQLVRSSIPQVSDIAVLRTLQYLSGGSVGILQIKFEMFNPDDEGEAPYILTSEEAAGAIHEGINPFTGGVDPELKQKVGIFFEPGEGFKLAVGDLGDASKGGGFD